MKRLSTWIVITVNLIFGIYLGITGTIGAGDVVFFVSSAVGLYWIRSGILSRDLEFDEEFFYYKRDTKIPFSSITAIKLGIGSDLQNDRYWRIEYKVGARNEEPITVLRSVTNDKFVKFLRAVEARNPSIKADIFEFELLWGFMPKTTWRVRDE